ncbi:TetR/AcrR family transcriptional regulator [Streptomyces violaceorubidus]|uniref:TetR/AcrR family transcriptional regulator n=1 Tax=Streptomyces violaceorubidus TaxID=284042 RepID=UPI0004BFBE42|nr:TetR/AcrR family transcriptional regulator [Streptomyces violaceorubidus]
MGNREDLLAGARRCLEEKGWARTTVRDITAASGGVSMAAIGYHFGSREGLLNAALIETIEEWGASVGRSLASFGAPEATAAERYEAMWDRIIASFSTHRALWLASVEAVTQAEHSGELRRHLADGQAQGRRGIAALLTGADEAAVGDEDTRTLGTVQMALLSGLIMQWLTDPEHTPTGADIVAGLRTLAHTVGTHA